jgi:hypothetical protein
MVSTKNLDFDQWIKEGEFKYDVFQPLEALNGFSIASIITEHPKILLELLEKDANEESSKSII